MFVNYSFNSFFKFKVNSGLVLNDRFLQPIRLEDFFLQRYDQYRNSQYWMTSLNILLNFLCAVLIKYMRCSVIKKAFYYIYFFVCSSFIVSFNIYFLAKRGPKRAERSEQGGHIGRKISGGRTYFCIFYSFELKLCRMIELCILKYPMFFVF